jgi:hypothetical protein
MARPLKLDARAGGGITGRGRARQRPARGRGAGGIGLVHLGDAAGRAAAVDVNGRLEGDEAAVAAEVRVQTVARHGRDLRDELGRGRVDEDLPAGDRGCRGVAHVGGIGAQIAVRLEGDAELDELPVARDARMAGVVRAERDLRQAGRLREVAIEQTEDEDLPVGVAVADDVAVGLEGPLIGCPTGESADLTAGQAGHLHEGGREAMQRETRGGGDQYDRCARDE